MNASLFDGVGCALREAAETAILPRFRALVEGEIEEKAPGEVVTIADREAERLIAHRLVELLPGSRVVGEEACALDPGLVGGIGEGMVWIVDPLDGTANFAAGDPVFAVMVALLRDGETIAGWMFEPIADRLAAAELGAGAWLGGERLAPRDWPGGALRGSIGRFMPDAMREDLHARADRLGERLPGLMCAGAEYPRIASGERDFAFYWRTLVWDHAPGVLFLNEAGGKATRPDGTPYRPTEEGRGLLAARSPEIWEAARAGLVG